MGKRLDETMKFLTSTALRRRLKKMKVGSTIHLNGITYPEKIRWYQAALKVGIKISIKTTPVGTTLWRVL